MGTWKSEGREQSMSVFKQGEIWWYEFTLNGHRIRKSSKTADRDLAKLIEAEHRRSLEGGTGGISPTYQALHAKEPAKPIQPPKAGTAPEQITRAMTLAEAGELWLTQKSMEAPEAENARVLPLLSE
jgi:hypothetical protein